MSPMNPTRPAAPLPRLVHDVRYSPPGRVAVAAMKGVLRGAGMATVARRPGFDFIVIGTKRGGTTSLWRYLAAHPGVLPLYPLPAKVKGTYYLADEWRRGERWWRSHAPTERVRAEAESRLGYRPVVGEASPYYLYHPLAPERMARLLPDAFAVAVLRDPVERAWSHYKERLANDTEPLAFEAAIEAEPGRLAGEEQRILADPKYRSFAHRHQSYVDQGRYAPMLQRWFDALGRDRVMVHISEEMYADPQAAVDQVTDRLSLPRVPLRDARAHNAEPSEDLSPEVRARLTSLLADDIVATEEVLGRSLPWPR